ncbi:MAG: ABC transporter permease [Anaerolineaceae bacterium]
MSSVAETVQPVPIIELRERTGRLKSLWRVARKKPIGAGAGIVCILLILIAVFASQLAPHPVDAQAFPRLRAPSLTYPMGTDNLFRDMFSRIIVGSRISLGVGFAAVFVGTVIGAVLGMVGGYLGGWADLIIGRVLDVMLGFPPLVFLIFFLSIFNNQGGYSLKSFLLISVAIGVIIAPTTARIVRGAVLSIRNLQYIEAAQSIGNTTPRIMVRHVLPNVVAPIIVIASIQIGNAILAEAALSFLGLGIANAGHPSWGALLQDTRAVWQQAWWTAFMPGLAISLAVLSFNLFGDALRDVLDPRLRQ